jgi:hypothetical protein
MQMWEAGFEKQARGQLEGKRAGLLGHEEKVIGKHHTAGTRRFCSSGVMIVWLCPLCYDRLWLIVEFFQKASTFCHFVSVFRFCCVTRNHANPRGLSAVSLLVLGAIANYCNKDLTACIQAPHHGQTSVISPRITNHPTSRSAVFRRDPLRMLSDITFSLMAITAGRKAYCHMTAMRTNRCRSMACIDRRCQGERRPEGCAGYC